MPVVLRIGPYQFGFFASDIDEPAHIHVRPDRMRAKYWPQPNVRLQSQRGFSDHELNLIGKIVAERRAMLLEKWHEHFDD